MENHPDAHPFTSSSYSHGQTAQSASAVLEPNGWEQICEILRRKLGEDNFSRCFSGTRARIKDGQRLLLSVPNPIHQLWIESNFSGILNDAVAEVLGTAASIEFNVTSDQPGFLPPVLGPKPVETPIQAGLGFHRF